MLAHWALCSLRLVRQLGTLRGYRPPVWQVRTALSHVKASSSGRRRVLGATGSRHMVELSDREKMQAAEVRPIQRRGRSASLRTKHTSSVSRAPDGRRMTGKNPLGRNPSRSASSSVAARSGSPS